MWKTLWCQTWQWIKLWKPCKDICSKASQKIYILARVVPYMNLSKRPILINAFFNTWWSYCPLVWISHNGTTNRKIRRLLEILLEKDNSVSTHYRNVQVLATEMYKVSKGLPLFGDIFKQKDGRSYSLWNNSQFSIPLLRTVFHETMSISCLGPIIWDIHFAI